MSNRNARSYLLPWFVIPCFKGTSLAPFEAAVPCLQVLSVKLPAANQVAVIQRMTDDLDVLHYSDPKAHVHVRPLLFEKPIHLMNTFNLTVEVVVGDIP